MRLDAHAHGRWLDLEHHAGTTEDLGDPGNVGGVLPVVECVLPHECVGLDLTCPSRFTQSLFRNGPEHDTVMLVVPIHRWWAWIRRDFLISHERLRRACRLPITAWRGPDLSLR